MKIELNALNRDEAGSVRIEVSAALPHIAVEIKTGPYSHAAFLEKGDALLLGQFLINLAMKMEGHV